jgi:hypothetical protein
MWPPNSWTRPLWLFDVNVPSAWLRRSPRTALKHNTPGIAVGWGLGTAPNYPVTEVGQLVTVPALRGPGVRKLPAEGL